MKLGGGNDKEKVGNDGENKCQAANESVETRLRLAEEARRGSGARVAQVPRYLSARQPYGCLNSTPYAPKRSRYLFHRSRSFLPSDSRIKTSRAAALPLPVRALTAAEGEETSWPSCSTIVPSGEIVTT